jgi:hypothetical protein
MQQTLPFLHSTSSAFILPQIDTLPGLKPNSFSDDHSA